MATVGFATLQVIPSLRGVQSSIESQMRSMGGPAGQAFSAPFSARLGEAAGKTAQAVSNAFTTAAAAGAGALAVSLSRGWDRLTTLQDSTAALTISLQDAGAAASLLDDVLGVVSGTPFNLDQFAQGAQQMVGMGIEAEKVPGYLEAIGEAAATQGGRAGEMASRLTTVFGQISASGQVALNDVWRISDTGVNALAILGNHFGVTTDQMKDMISNGAVPASEALDVLADGIVNGSDGVAGATVALGGSMEALRLTMSGAVGGIEPAMARLGAALIEPLSPAIIVGANALSDSFDLLGKRGGEMMSAFAETAGFERALDLVGQLPDMLDGALDSLEKIAPMAAGASSAMIAMSTQSLSRMVPFLPAVNPVVAGLAAITLATPAARDALGSVASEVAPIIAELGSKLLPILVDLSEIAGDVLPPAIDLFGVGLTTALNLALPLADTVASLTGFLSDHSEVVMAAGAAWLVFSQRVLLAKAIGGVSAALGVLNGVMVAATAGTITMTGAMGTAGLAADALRMKLASISPATMGIGAAMVGVAVGAGLAQKALNDWHDTGRERAQDWLDTIGDIDTTSMESVSLHLSDLSGRQAELRRQMELPYTGRAEREKIAAEILEIGLAFDEVEPGAKRMAEGMTELGTATGLSVDELLTTARTLGIDLVPALMSGEVSAGDLAIEINRTAREAAATRGRIAELSAEFGGLSDAAAEGLGEAVDAARTLFGAEQNLLSSHRAVADAMEELSDARRAARLDSDEYRRAQDAIADAQKAVVDAERSLADAQRDSLSAQLDLTRARADAEEQLGRLAFGAEGAALSEESARFSLEDARKALREAKPEDRARADLRVRQAELALREATARRADADADLADAQRRGIEGSDQVVAAKGRVQTAAERETEAHERLGEAHRQVSERQAEAAAVAAEAQERVKEATESLNETMLDHLETQAELTSMTEGTATATAELIGNLDDLAGTLDPGSSLLKNVENYRDRLTKAMGVFPRFSEMVDALFGGGQETLLGLPIPQSGSRWWPFEAGGIASYAEGGIHQAVGPSGVLRFAEPSTGGEAFLPRLGIDSGRAKAILDVAAGWHGLGIVDKRKQEPIYPTPLALGGVIGAPGAAPQGRGRRAPLAGASITVNAVDVDHAVNRVLWEAMD